MNKEQFERERQYQATITIAKGMFKKGLITADELAIIDTKMREKYAPCLGSICPENTLKLLDFTPLQSDL